MAKIQSQPAAGGKPVGHVSTSGIFEKLKTHDQLRNGRQRLTGRRSFLVSQSSKRKRKVQHPLAEAFSGTVEESRRSIENGTKTRLDTVRDALITQNRAILQTARDRSDKADNSSRELQRPLDDELLELTRRDGTVITMTLGKRMNAYRKLVDRERENLNKLFEQWQEVTSEINSFATELFGPKGIESILGNTNAELPVFETADLRALMAQLEAEKDKARAVAAAIGAKAIKAMEAGEKDLTVKHKQNMLQLCNSMFGEDED
ncbi:MAG: hypothetical protein Q9166_006070 [cf. Caloplaca sp. 2 TL-2023]